MKTQMIFRSGQRKAIQNALKRTSGAAVTKPEMRAVKKAMPKMPYGTSKLR